jgi:F420-0:gamma-glutamyl ligase-like protein
MPVNKLKALAVTTPYWKPGDDYSREVLRVIVRVVEDGDFVVISEKAISTALGNIVDETTVKPSLTARIISRFWMRVVWGYFLCVLCHFRKKLTHEIRAYPLEMGSRHKQVAIRYSSPLQALMFGSEGGIDGSNLPYSYVSLPLRNVNRLAERMRSRIEAETGKSVFVVISDTDKTYSLRNFHFTPRPYPMKGIRSFGGFIAYVAGKMFRLRKRATPLTVVGGECGAEVALKVAEVANRARGSGAGRTVWDMAEYFKTGLGEVSWEMLDRVRHKPVVIVRMKK